MEQPEKRRVIIFLAALAALYIDISDLDQPMGDHFSVLYSVLAPQSGALRTLAFS